MDVKQLYENVSIRVPLDTRSFLDYLNETLAELSAMFDDYVFKTGEEGAVMHTMEQKLPIRPPYFPALVYNILYLCGYDKNGTFKSEFVRLATDANERIKTKTLKQKSRIIKRTGW